MSRSAFTPELRCEELVRRIIGEGWRTLPSDEIDGAWGVAIVRSVLDGVGSGNEPHWRLRSISNHLGVDTEILKDAFMRLSLNGVFQGSKLYDDRKALNNMETLAWCYYAGIAEGAIGNVVYRSSKFRKKREIRS